MNTRCFADDERGREHPTPGDGQQRGREHADQVAQLVLKGSDLLGQVAAAFEQFAGEPGDPPSNRSSLDSRPAPSR